MTRFNDVKEELGRMLSEKPSGSPVEAIAKAFMLQSKLLYVACSELSHINYQLTLINVELNKKRNG
jgi:hypothetical protein